MTFFNQILLARNIQGQVQSILAKSRQRLIVTFPNNPIPQTTQFDIMQSFLFKNSVTLTKNPVEQGANLTDHRIQQPTELTIRVGTSNIIDPFTAAIELDAAAVVQALSLQIVGNQIANGRISATYLQLKNAMENSEVFDLDTPLGLVKNLLITSIVNENDDESITTFEGTITMQEVLFFDNLRDPNTIVSGISALDRVLRPILTPFEFPTLI